MINHIFIDMDNTIADFDNSPAFGGKGYELNPPEMYQPGFFENLQPMDGALGGVRAVIQYAKPRNIDVHILSKPVGVTAYNYSEKVSWILRWFPELRSKINLNQEKGLLSKKGRILIDDFDEWEKPWSEEGGDFILFDKKNSSLSQWLSIVERIKSLNG